MSVLAPLRRPLVPPLRGPLSTGALPWESSGGGAPYSGPLLAWADGTFLRTTEASYHTAADVIAWASANARREDVLFGETLTLIESQRTNLAIRSEDWNGWGQVSLTLTLNVGTAPDGGSDAATIAFNAATNARLTATIVQPNGTIVTWSRWVKNHTGGGDTRLQVVQRDAATEVSLASAAGTGWTREVNRAASVGSGASNPQLWHRNGTTAVARTIYAWGGQCEVARYETSYIRTGNGAVTRDADQATWLAAGVPLLLRTQPSKIRVAPWWAHGDLVSGDVRTLYSWGADDCLRVRHDGSNVVLEAVVGGVVKATKTISSVTRRVALTVSCDPVAGTVTWDGVAGSAGTPWTWPDGQFRLGGELGGSSEWDGGLALPTTVNA